MNSNPDHAACGFYPETTCMDCMPYMYPPIPPKVEQWLDTVRKWYGFDPKPLSKKDQERFIQQRLDLAYTLMADPDFRRNFVAVNNEMRTALTIAQARPDGKNTVD